MNLTTWLTAAQDLLHYQLFMVNQTPVTLASLLVFCTIIGVLMFVSKMIREILTTWLSSHLQLSSGTHFMLIRLSQYLFWFLGGVVAFQFIGIDLSALAVIFGFLSVGIGFGMQNLTSNFISGLMLLFEQHIQIGDRVTVGETEGDVVEINFRSTTIRSLNNIAIIVPNSEFISGTVINWSHGDPKTRLEIDVGVSYNSDRETVMHALLAAATQNPLVLKDPRPGVWFMGFGDSAWNMRLLVWVDSPKIRAQVMSDINCAIVDEFRKNGIEIPFPQRDLHLRTQATPFQVATTA
jgi:small-conductance mechanosensitive channel